MTKRRRTRRALINSVISLLICFSMLLGTTFAWFTDSVESVNNKIVAGNLDVELEYYDENAKEYVPVNQNTNVFKKDTLWEPGHTEVVHLKVRNAGTLALKYQLGVNVASETPGTNVENEVFRLSNHIEFGAIETNKIYTDREEARKAITASEKLAVGYTKSSELYPVNDTKGDAEKYVALVVFMPEEVTNEANYKTGTTPPQINLGLNLLATQLVHENDSFGPDYDKDASWVGNADTSWYNTTDTEFTLDTAEELAGLATLVNNGTDSFVGKTIKLGADIDLNGDEGVLWTPIGKKGNPFNGRFIGTGYTISNLNAVGTENVGLIGFATNAAHIEGVTIETADVTGTHYVGAVLGYGYLAKDCLINCTVTDATIICNPTIQEDGTYDDGNQAGVIAGMALNGNITGNTAKDSKVYAYRDMGGIVGCASAENRSITVEGNTVENVELIKVGVMGEYDPKDANMGEIVGRKSESYSNKVNIGTNTATNVTMDTAEAITINTLEELVDFAKKVNSGRTYAGEIVLLGADIDLGNREWTPIGNSTNKFQGTFDGQGHTISNLSITGNNSYVGLFGFTTNGAIKNLTLNNASVSGYLGVGAVAGSPYTSTYDNIKLTGLVKINGMAYVGGVVGRNAYANISNITVDVDDESYVKANSVENGTAYRTYVGGVIGFMGEGGHKVSNVTSNIDVIGSTIDVGGIVGIAHYGNTFENITCTGNVEITGATEAGDAEEIGGIAGVWNNGGANVTFTNCKYTGTLSTNITEGVDLSNNTITGKAYSATGTGKLIIDDLYAVADADTLVELLENGEDVVLTSDVKINPAGMSNAYGTTGINVKNGQTIDGGGNVLDIKGAGGTWDSGINTTGGLIKNITVTGSFRGIFINHNSEHCEKVVLENVTIDGTTYTISCDQGSNQGLEATKSTFKGWTSYAATLGKAKFEDCYFGYGNGYRFCRPYAPTEFVGCEFEDGFKMDPRATVTFENCTIGGVALTAENLATLVTSNIANATVK